MRFLSRICCLFLLMGGLFPANAEIPALTAPALPVSQLKVAAQKPDAKAILAYANALAWQRHHDKSNISDNALIGIYRRAADLGSAEAWARIAELTDNTSLRRQAFLESAERGYVPVFDNALDEFFFLDEGKPDIAAAKKVADLARKYHIPVGYSAGNLGYGAEDLKAVDICYAAGTPEITPDEKQAIKADDRGTGFSQNQVYATAFANGYGVKRDVKRAIAFACQGGGNVPAELTGQVLALAQMAAHPEKAETFDVCRYATSGAHTGGCAEDAQEATQKQRDHELDQMAAGMTVPQKSAFAALRKAAKAYFKIHASEEVDMSGTARGEFYADALDRIQQRFVQQLERYNAWHFPAYQEDPTKAVVRMQATLQQILSNPNNFKDTTITPAGVQKTQRAWMKYRDAWVRFATVFYGEAFTEQMAGWAADARRQTLIWAFIHYPYTGH